MTREEMQTLIDVAEKTPKEMRIIGESYLNGDVLKDKVAAEAWLNKVIETGDNVDSMMAMMLLAKKILGKENVILENDYEDMEETIREMVKAAHSDETK